MSITRRCKTHGVHTRWKRSQPPSFKKKGKGWHYKCRICDVRRNTRATSRINRRKNSELIAKHVGPFEAELYLNNRKVKISTYLYRGKGFVIPAQLFGGKTNESKFKKIVKLGYPRCLDFLKDPTCEKCGLKHENPRFFDIHHLVFRENGGGHIKENLLAVCPNCHRGFHMTPLPPKDPFALT